MIKKGKREEQKFTEEIVNSVTEDFVKRQAERKEYERQWQLNMNFYSGNQYCNVNRKGEITSEDAEFYWQGRNVYNHIAPIIETRLAKFARVNPEVYVRPKSSDDDDVVAASLAEKLISGAFKRNDFTEVVKRVTMWSEICGTAFYKVVWNNQGGNVIGSYDGNPVYEGEAEILPVSPFEIFPDSLYVENVSDLQSIIHAKALPVSVIKEKYGVSLIGKDIDVLNLSVTEGGEKINGKSGQKMQGAEIVIEKYEAPSMEFPNGRMITVAGDKLLYYGELPYIGGENGERTYPFVKQESIRLAGSFFGVSVIERLIPVQRAFNAVKNRKHEFLNRLSAGVMTVEEGSVDLDDLAEEGLAPGKVLVYRQGYKEPEMLKVNAVPTEFEAEEGRLINEFVVISGVSDVASSSNNANVSSGSALQILIEQDNERLTVNAETIRRCYLATAKKVLKLYSQFISGVRAVKAEDDFDKVKVYYADKNTAMSDDVYLDSENELMYTPQSRKETVFNLYKSGLLAGADGKISASVKEKVLSLLGYKDLDSQKGIAKLQEEKAQNENNVIRKKGMEIDEIDDHKIHIDEHTRYFLSESDELTKEEKTRLIEHIKGHKEALEKEKAEENKITEKEN